MIFRLNTNNNRHDMTKIGNETRENRKYYRKWSISREIKTPLSNWGNNNFSHNQLDWREILLHGSYFLSLSKKCE